MLCNTPFNGNPSKHVYTFCLLFEIGQTIVQFGIPYGLFVMTVPYSMLHDTGEKQPLKVLLE